MGAHGYGAYDNDTSMEWLERFASKEAPLGMMRKILASERRGPAVYATTQLVAELVASKRGARPAQFPDEAAAVLAVMSAPTDDDVAAARAAVVRMATDPRYVRSWRDPAAHHAALSDLHERLGGDALPMPELPEAPHAVVEAVHDLMGRLAFLDAQSRATHPIPTLQVHKDKLPSAAAGVRAVLAEHGGVTSVAAHEGGVVVVVGETRHEVRPKGPQWHDGLVDELRAHLGVPETPPPGGLLRRIGRFFGGS
jgi:hypothetical protein